MNDSPNGSEEANKNFFGRLASIASEALSAEWQTDAGRINSFGMIAALAIACIAPVLSFIQWIAVIVTAWVRGTEPPALFDVAQTMIAFLICTLLCVGMLAAQSIANSRRGG